MSPVDPYTVESFEAFWPHYVRLHTRRETHWMHALGTSSAMSLVLTGVLLRQPWVLVFAPLVDYAVSQLSRRVFEKNRTLPWKNTLWHARAEWRMFRLTLRGRMQNEVRWFVVPDDLAQSQAVRPAGMGSPSTSPMSPPHMESVPP